MRNTAHLQIHCGDCGTSWEVHKYMPTGSTPTFCPLCGAEIDPMIWQDLILPAASMLHKANKALIEAHTDHHTTPFFVDVIADHYCKDDVNPNWERGNETY